MQLVRLQATVRSDRDNPGPTSDWQRNLLWSPISAMATELLHLRGRPFSGKLNGHMDYHGTLDALSEDLLHDCRRRSYLRQNTETNTRTSLKNLRSRMRFLSIKEVVELQEELVRRFGGLPVLPE